MSAGLWGPPPGAATLHQAESSAASVQAARQRQLLRHWVGGSVGGCSEMRHHIPPALCHVWYGGATRARRFDGFDDDDEDEDGYDDDDEGGDMDEDDM